MLWKEKVLRIVDRSSHTVISHIRQLLVYTNRLVSFNFSFKLIKNFEVIPLHHMYYVATLDESLDRYTSTKAKKSMFNWAFVILWDCHHLLSSTSWLKKTIQQIWMVFLLQNEWGNPYSGRPQSNLNVLSVHIKAVTSLHPCPNKNHDSWQPWAEGLSETLGLVLLLCTIKTK